jgi:hypothetical protein
MTIILVTSPVNLLVKRISFDNFDRVMRTISGSVLGIILLVNDSPGIYNTLSSPFYGS